MSPDQDTTRLYELYGQDLYRFCLARLRSPEEAEDAVQNTFIRVVRALEAGAEPEFESAWLYRIATNVCLSRRTLTGRRAQWQADEEIEQLPLAAPDTDPETRRALIEAVTSLPKNQRDAILLREWQGLSYAEIADSLDTSVPAVETLLVRARRQLVSLLRSRTRGGILDGLLLLRVRSWFAAASPAQLAAGAVVVALGGVAVGTDVGAARTHPSPATRTAAAASARVVTRENVPHVRPPRVATARVEATATRTGATQVAVRAAPPVSAVSAPAPRAAPPADSPRSAPISAPATGATSSAPATLADVAPPVALPTISVPAVTVPEATLPVVPTLPVAPVEVTVPAVTVPTATVTVPAPTLPSVLP